MIQYYIYSLRYTLCILSILPISDAFSASSFPRVQNGIASWYGGAFFHSKKTADNEKFDNNALTAAHRSLPFGTKVRVELLKTHRSIVVTINDRGPFSHHRIIDLSQGAARKIGLVNSGVSPVSLTVLPTSSAHPSQKTP